MDFSASEDVMSMKRWIQSIQSWIETESSRTQSDDSIYHEKADFAKRLSVIQMSTQNPTDILAGVIPGAPSRSTETVMKHPTMCDHTRWIRMRRFLPSSNRFTRLLLRFHLCINPLFFVEYYSRTAPTLLPLIHLTIGPPQLLTMILGFQV